MSKIYAVDFDGTLCRSNYPQIGNPISETIEFVKKLKEGGDKIILWTCRSGEMLEEAVKWCEEQDIEFDAINENLDEIIEQYDGDSRKITADFYIDDKNLFIDDLVGGDEMERNQTDNILTRSTTNNLKAREKKEDGKLYLEGYFVVFNEETELFKGGYEEVDKNAFNNTLDNDIRCLINHDTTLVLGRNKSKTLELKVDSTGLYGKVEINKDDSDAMNIYQRVKRGDVSGNSFGFNILNEETDYREDGTIKWTIKEIDLHEVSITTFPAYEQTSIQARKQQHEQHEKRKKDLVKNKLKERLNKIC